MQGQIVLFLCTAFVLLVVDQMQMDNLTYTWEQTDWQQPVVLGIVSLSHLNQMDLI
jgi:hypothetical protein